MTTETLQVWLPLEQAEACLRRAYPLAVASCLPPPGEPFIDPESGPYASPDDLVGMLAQQFEVELCRLVGREFNSSMDLARSVGVAA